MAAAAAYRLAVVIKGSSGDDFVVARQAPSPSLSGEEYQRYVDSDLWDLPTAPLKPLEGGIRSDVIVAGADSCAEKLDLGSFDLDFALNEVLSQVGLEAAICGDWVFWKYVEEAEFGPQPLVHSLFMLGRMKSHEEVLEESCKWMSKENVLKLLLDVKPGNDRVGPFVVYGLLSDLVESRKWKAPPTLHYQEYPPGIVLVPMRSKTLKPFRTTNLVVMVSDNLVNGAEGSGYVAYGDALLMDPGCCSESHAELEDLVTSLPRKLVVFVTHHHHDHIDGLVVVRKCNPEAILLTHESTMARIGKEVWSLGYTSISGGEKIQVGGQQLEAIYAPGHTDGHLALLHVKTNSLVVGDHCVGQGTTILDIRAGGSLKDYFQTTYKFLELSPHVLIPMHGRLNMWPKRMLCGYLKHRLNRESSILKAIESGANSLSDIVARSYPGLDTKLWFAASLNVQVHVDHLAHQEKLPKVFSMEKFKASCGFHFISRWMWAYIVGMKPSVKVLFAAASGVAMSIIIKGVLASKGN